MVRLALIPLLARVAMTISLLFGVMALLALLIASTQGSGNMVAFLGADKSFYHIYLLDTDRLTYTRLEDIPARIFMPSADRRQIAFLSPLDGGQEYAIFIMDIFGGHQHRVAQTSEAVPLSGAFVWSPDGTQLAFADKDQDAETSSGNQSTIFVVDVRDGIKWKIPYNDIPFRAQLVWSPDSTQLAFADIAQDSETSSGNQSSIFVVDVGDGVTRQIPYNQDPNTTQLVWSPDGKQIAATAYDLSEYRLRSQVLMVSLEDAETQLLTAFETGEVSKLTWSPDGKSLEFWWTEGMREDSLTYQFYSMDSDGKNLQMLSQGQADSYFWFNEGRDPHPVYDSHRTLFGAWTPDNQWMAYTADMIPPPPTPRRPHGTTSDSIVISRPDGSEKRIFVSSFYDIWLLVYIPY